MVKMLRGTPPAWEGLLPSTPLMLVVSPRTIVGQVTNRKEVSLTGLQVTGGGGMWLACGPLH